MRFRYPQPTNEDEFEEFCLRLFRLLWNLPQLERFGSRGERQHGVDLIDLSGTTPLRGIQCKHHDSTKLLSSSEVRKEVAKARRFKPALDNYFILTTAKRSTRAQKSIIALNRSHRSKGLFTIELLTWEAIERLIDDRPEARELLGGMTPPIWKEQAESLKEHVSRAIGALALPARPTAPLDVFDAEIDEAKAHLDAHEYQLARLLLNRLRVRHWDHLSARQRYRVTVNTAMAALGTSDYATAGRQLADAASYQPGDPDALAFEALGYELLEQPDTALEKAQAVLRSAPLVSRAAAVVVRTAPSSRTFDDLMQQINPAAINSEVALAFAMRAMKERRFDVALEMAERATKDSPDWAPALFQVGNVLYTRETDKMTQDRSPAARVDRAALEKAGEALTEAIRTARRQTPPHAVVLDALLVRRLVHELLGTSGELDLQDATAMAPDDPRVIEVHALAALDRGSYEDGIGQLRKAASLSTEPRLRFLLGVHLTRKDDPQSRREAAELFRSTVSDPELPFQTDAALFALRQYCALGDWNAAEAFVSYAQPHLSSSITAVLTSTLRLAQNKLDEAHEAAARALTELGGDAPRAAVRQVANLLTSLGLYAEALPLWQRAVVQGIRTPEAENLIACASRLERHDVALAACRSLREAHQTTENIFEYEVGLLERYDAPEAVRILQEHLHTHQSDRSMRLRLSLLGRRLQRPDLVATSEAELPSVDEVGPEAVPFVVALLRDMDPPRALAYAYGALRRYFDRPEAHRTYVSLFLQSDRHLPEIAEAMSVGPGTAVRIREDGTTSDRWIVVEEGAPVYAALSEVSAGDPLARRLSGHTLGDRVVIAESPVKNRTAVVEEIVSKYAYRYRDVADNWQLRFPEPFVQAFRIETDETPNGKVDIAPILKAVDQRHEHVIDILGIYRTRPMSIALVAKALGDTILAAMGQLAGTPDIAIAVGERSPDDVDRVLALLKSGTKLVPDATAIATTVLLETELPVSLLGRLMLPVGVNDDINAMRFDLSAHRQGASIAKVPGGHVWNEHTERDRTERDKVSRYLEKLQAGSEVVGCPALAALAPERRNQLQQVLGSGGAEALAASAGQDRLFWTDDGVAALIARHEYGILSVSTELVLRYLAESGLIDRQEYVGACGKLLSFNFVPTPMNADVLVESARLAKWDPKGFPLQEVLALCCNDKFASVAVIVVVSEAIAKLFLAIDLKTVRDALVVSILSAVRRRKDGIRVIEKLRSRLVLTFGLNVTGLAEAAALIDGWLCFERTHPER